VVCFARPLMPHRGNRPVGLCVKQPRLQNPPTPLHKQADKPLPYHAVATDLLVCPRHRITPDAFQANVAPNAPTPGWRTDQTSLAQTTPPMHPDWVREKHMGFSVSRDLIPGSMEDPGRSRPCHPARLAESSGRLTRRFALPECSFQRWTTSAE